MKRKRKRLSTFKFSNGASFTVDYVPKPPKVARRSHDYLFVSVNPAQGRGKANGWFMNAYDVNSLVWALCGAINHIQLKRLPHR